MAEKIENFDGFARTGGRPKYPWDQWFDGSVWKLTQGEDFQPRPLEFATQVRQVAARKELKVRCSVRGDSLYVQAYDPKTEKHWTEQ